MSLTRQETILDIESNPPEHNKPVRFANRSCRAPEVGLDWVRWVEMGSPDQVLVTVEPLSRAPFIR
jgi:hypothetical protein